MNRALFDKGIYFLFLFISFICLVGALGINNISFQSIEWINYNGGDITLPHTSWYFFKNDIWRFPPGSNPNYGDELGNSIIFSDSIPILALFFKSLKSFIPENFQYISFRSTKWLHTIEKFNRDPALYQTAWYFFLNDIWRFPLGSNPNYGMGISSSIVISDTIPILSFFFKSLKSFIPENFQYFSFWFFVCFYFQLFFSFKILKKFTNSTSYSFIGSIFFLLAPIFIYIYFFSLFSCCGRDRKYIPSKH